MTLEFDPECCDFMPSESEQFSWHLRIKMRNITFLSVDRYPLSRCIKLRDEILDEMRISDGCD